MIDHDIIRKSTETAKAAIANCRSTPSENLYLINSVFDNSLVDKLKSYLGDATAWHGFDTSESRKVITWDSDTVIEELHEVCNNLTDEINQRFFSKKLNYLGIQIWRDTDQFHMAWHRDNAIINVSMQVYMFDIPSKYGTSFLIDGQEFAVPYQHNNGYIAICDSIGLEHKPTTQVSKDINRCSIYAIWSLSEKIVKKDENS